MVLGLPPAFAGVDPTYVRLVSAAATQAGHIEAVDAGKLGGL
jgi:hypothetical protein